MLKLFSNINTVKNLIEYNIIYFYVLNLDLNTFFIVLKKNSSSQVKLVLILKTFDLSFISSRYYNMLSYYLNN